MRGLTIFLFFFLLFLASEPSGHAFVKTIPLADTTKTATDSILESWLRKQTVISKKTFPKTLWFWTTAKELDSVAQQRALLRTFLPATSGEKIYEERLTEKKWDNNPLAAILRGSMYRRKVEAWSSYWPVVSSGERDQLVQVEMEDSALVATFSPGENIPFEVYDLKGNPVPLPQVEQVKSRIALVFFSERVRSVREEISGNNVKCKEYWTWLRTFFICNEKMIRAWRHDVPGVQDQVLKDLNYLLLFHAWAEAHPQKAVYKGGKHFPSCWKEESTDADIASLYVGVRPYAREGKEMIEPELKQFIALLRENWKKQANAVEKYPSRGMK